MKSRRHFLKKTSLAGLAFSSVIPDKFSPHEHGKENRENTGPSLGSNYKYLNFITAHDSDPITRNAVRIVRRIVSQRTGLNFTAERSEKLDVNLIIVPKAVPAESFRIEHVGNNSVTITAGDSNGILYGLGKFLHTSSLTGDGFTPGSWQGLSVPEKSFRKIYFATHFYNFYHIAPVEKLTEYIEELALWGYNGLVVWFDMHHFTGINDPEAQKMLDRLALLLREGKKVGMDAALTLLANEGYSTSPEELRAESPLQLKIRGEYGVEICPAKPGGPELVVRQISEEIDAFASRGVELDYLSIWPYDQGGCGCKDCVPWGNNGFLKMTKHIAAMVKEKKPHIRLVQSTWLFDAIEDEGEWVGLARAYQKEKPPVDYIMADSHNEFPKYPLENPVPGNLPMLNFPEISMWGSAPWGGFGANPLPQRFQIIWDSVKHKLAGGFPYSEGLFEDINKVICSQFYWQSDRPVYDIVREYASFEYSAKYADQIVEAIQILEKNHGLKKWKGRPAVVPERDHGAERACRILNEVDSLLPESNKKGWRWRILMIRAMMDYEFRKNKGISNEKTDAGFRELMGLYFTGEKSTPAVTPPL